MVKRKIMKTQFLGRLTLVTLGLFGDVGWMFENIGWQQILDITPLTYIPLKLEFFSSMKIKIHKYDERNKGEISFRLANIEHSLTLQQLNQIYGFSKNGERLKPSDYIDTIFWKHISKEHGFNAWTSRVSSVSNLVLWYMHKVLAHTIFGRGESNRMVRSFFGQCYIGLR